MHKGPIRGRFVAGLAVSLLFAALPAVAPQARAADPHYEFTTQNDSTWMTNDPADKEERVDDIHYVAARDTVYVGGGFTAIWENVGGPDVDQPFIAAFKRGDGSRQGNFAPIVNGRVRTIASSPGGDILYIGGDFTVVDGAARIGLAAIDPVTGALITSFDAKVALPPDYDPASHPQIVRTIAVRPNGDVYIGGRFNSVNGATHNRLARLNGTTGAALSWSASAERPVWAMRLDRSPTTNRIWVGGDFTTINGDTAAQRIVGLDLDSGAIVKTFSPSPAYVVIALDADAANVFVGIGGNAQTVPDPSETNNARAYRISDGTQAKNWHTDGDVQAVEVVGDRVYFGGHWISKFGGQTSKRIAAVDVDTLDIDMSFQPTIFGSDGLWAFMFDGYRLWVGGHITKTSPPSSSQRGFVRYDQVAGSDRVPPTRPTNLTAIGTGSSTIDLAWSPSTDDSNSVLYQISQNGGFIDSTLSPSFTVTGLDAGVTYSFAVTAVDPSGNPSPPSDPATTTTLVVDNTFIPKGDEWRYLHDASDPGTAWRGVGFDDSGWSNGPAELGYGDGDEITDLGGPADPGQITTYFRRTITLPAGTTTRVLELGLLRDDGAVVYINGTEVARNNMPAGPVDYLTKAATGVEDGDTFYQYLLDPTRLIPGTNVVAVEIHQVSTGSSDISFDATLTGSTSAAVSIVAPPGSDTVSGTTTIKVDAPDLEDAPGTVNVDVAVDGGPWQDATWNAGSGYYELPWDTTALTDGAVTLTARSIDGAQNTETSPPVSVNVANTDATPTVSLTSPSGGATVSGTVDITVIAADLEDPASSLEVEVSINGGAWQPVDGPDPTRRYRWDTTGVADGSATLRARVTDSAPHVVESSTVTVTVSNSDPPPDFTDVPAGHRFEADIVWLADAGITTGCNPPQNDRFCPNDPVTRGQMAAFLTRALGLTATNPDNDFTDDNGSPFETDINRLATAGITTGCNPPQNDRFCPNDPVTRGQMAAFLRRALDT